MKERRKTFIAKNELTKLPYLIYIPIDGRIVPLQTYYEHKNGRWLKWIVADGKLQELRIIDLYHGTYISDKPVTPERDYRMPFAETVLKYFCTPKISDRMHQASQDLINCLGYIEKYFILLHHAQQFRGTNAEALLQIELEGIFGLHRSYYDLLQQIVNEVYYRYTTQRITLPDSFHKVVQKEPEELANKYHFPQPLVQFYQNKRSLFIACRQIRDNVFHHGYSLGSILTFDDGFAICVDEEPWTTLTPIINLWPVEKLRNKRLGSILVVFALLTEDMFKTLTWLGDAILASFREPPKACFDDNVYLRTHFARHLHRLNEYESDQWISPMQVLSEMVEGSQ